MKSKWLIILLRVILGGVFIFAGTLKIIDDSLLRDSVGIIVWLPLQLKILIIDLLPWAEVVMGSLVILASVPKWHPFLRLADIPTALLYLVFLIYAIVGWATGQEGDCGCFGSGIGSSFGWIMTLRNTLFVLGASILLMDSFRVKPRED
jgi:uncharacterized membrane protein YphA (DoxX/SURF4 family)